MGGRWAFQRAESVRLKGRQAVEGLAQRIHHATEQSVADADFEPLAGMGNQGAGGDVRRRIEQDDPQALLLQFEHQAPASIFEMQDLIHGGGGQAIDPGDAVAHGSNASLLAQPQRQAVVLHPPRQTVQQPVFNRHVRTLC